MRNHVCEEHTTLQLEIKTQSNTIVLQLSPPKCNSYVITLFKYNDLINKIPRLKIN